MVLRDGPWGANGAVRRPSRGRGPGSRTAARGRPVTRSAARHAWRGVAARVEQPACDVAGRGRRRVIPDRVLEDRRALDVAVDPDLAADAAEVPGDARRRRWRLADPQVRLQRVEFLSEC